MTPARAFLLAVLTVAAMATTTAAMAAPGPDTTGCAEATVRVATAAQAAVQAGDALALAETALAGAQAKVRTTTDTLITAHQAVLDEAIDTDAETAAVATASTALLDAVSKLAAAADPGPLADALAKARETLAAAIEARVTACAPPVVEPTETTAAEPPPVVFADCAAVRRADATPLLAGQPGYRPELDADRDNVACEAVEGVDTRQVRVYPRGGVDTGGWPSE